MRDDLEAAELDAIASSKIVARDLLWITAKNRDTGDDEDVGIWNDVMPVTLSVVDGRTGSTVDRDFYGVQAGMSIDPIPLTSDVTVRNFNITLPHLDDVVQQLVRGYDVRGAKMQLYRAYFDPDTRTLLASAKARFVGYIDSAPIVTPAEGGEGSITLSCVSTTRELTRVSSEVRSNESQILRSATDNFYADTAVVGDWVMFWGSTASNITTTTPPVIGGKAGSVA